MRTIFDPNYPEQNTSLLLVMPNTIQNAKSLSSGKAIALMEIRKGMSNRSSVGNVKFSVCRAAKFSCASRGAGVN